MSKTKVVTADEEKKTLTIARVFAAPRERVWEAWTNSALLEKWWAPKPWQAVTRSFDFREGGHWHYYMSGPEGEMAWARIDYLTVNPLESFSAEDAFSDETGEKNDELPGSHWHNEFHADGDATNVIVTITFASEVDLARTMEMGFDEGFAMALDNLDALLADNK